MGGRLFSSGEKPYPSRIGHVSGRLRRSDRSKGFKRRILKIDPATFRRQVRHHTSSCTFIFQAGQDEDVLHDEAGRSGEDVNRNFRASFPRCSRFSSGAVLLYRIARATSYLDG